MCEERTGLISSWLCLRMCRSKGARTWNRTRVETGLVNLVRQYLLTVEVASGQLGISVAEFEALL